MAVRAPGGALKCAYAGLVFKIVFDKVFSIYILHSFDSKWCMGKCCENCSHLKYEQTELTMMIVLRSYVGKNKANEPISYNERNSYDWKNLDALSECP